MTYQTLLAPGGATELKQDELLAALTELLTELQGKLETGQPVPLDLATIDALGDVRATVQNHPTDYPDAATVAAVLDVVAALAATLTVQGTVSVDNFPEFPPAQEMRDLRLDRDSVRQTLRVSQPCSVAVTGPVSNQVLVSVSPGQRLRLLRNAGHVDPQLTEAYPLVTVKIGETTIYRDKTEPGLPWAETVCFEGQDGEDLTVSVDVGTIYLNARYELF